MKHKVPKKINLFGHEITVEYDPDLRSKFGYEAMIIYNANKIVIQPHCEGVERTNAQLYESFLHELTHKIFEMIGRPELAQDEQLVLLFSRCLYQAVDSAVY